MTIEFVGLPGSGKTTLIKTLKENKINFFSYKEIYDLYFENLPFPSFLVSKLKFPLEKVKYLSFVFLKDLFISKLKSRKNWGFLKPLIKKGLPDKKERRYFVKHFKRRTSLQYIFSRKYKDKVLIFDEGELQILMTFLRKENIHQIKKYNANKVVVLSVSLDVALERIIKRMQKSPHKDNLYSETSPKLLEIKNNNLSSILEDLTKRSIPFFIVEGGMNFSDSLADFIKIN